VTLGHQTKAPYSMKGLITLVYSQYTILGLRPHRPYVSTAPHIVETAVRNVEQLDYSHITLTAVHLDILFCLVPTHKGAGSGIAVKALRYKQAGCGFDSR
jgi:hypothetical protein